MELLKISEVASRLRVSQITIRRMIARGELQAAKIGGGYRIKSEEVQRIVNTAK